jgi:hypothetical protein
MLMSLEIHLKDPILKMKALREGKRYPSRRNSSILLKNKISPQVSEIWMPLLQ